MAGGLTLGAGALVGALLGALTFGGAAWGANKMFDQEQQSFRLSGDYLNASVSQVLLKYLLISHFGRGRGRYTSPAAPSQWSELAQLTVQAHAAQWAALWAQLREANAAGTAIDAQRAAIMELLSQSLQQIMADLYPGLNADSGVRGAESAP